MNETPTRRGTTWRSWAAGLVILLSGIVVGSVGTLALVRHIVPAHRKPADAVAADMTRRLTRKLDLSGQQAAEVKAILSARIAELHRIRDAAIPQAVEQLQSIRQEISAVLDESQREKWERHVTHMEEALPPPPAATAPETAP
jgi:hypothetical protein